MTDTDAHGAGVADPPASPRATRWFTAADVDHAVLTGSGHIR